MNVREKQSDELTHKLKTYELFTEIMTKLET